AAHRTEVFAHSLLADIHPIETYFERGVCGKQVRCLIPQAAIEVVTVGALQTLDRVGVLEEGLASLQRCDPSLQLTGTRNTRCAHGVRAGRDQYRERGRKGCRACNRCDHLTRPFFALTQTNHGSRQSPPLGSAISAGRAMACGTTA